MTECMLIDNGIIFNKAMKCLIQAHKHPDRRVRLYGGVILERLNKWFDDEREEEIALEYIQEAINLFYKEVDKFIESVYNGRAA